MPEPCWSIRLAGWLIFYALIPWHCQAQSSQGTHIEIQGAGEVLPLLNEHLQIFRLIREQKLSPEELQRLISITPQQIKDLLATEGYFSSRVSTEVTHGDHDYGTRFIVSPGEPTRIHSIALTFSGAISQNPAESERIRSLKKSWLLKTGDIFRQSSWDDAKNNLLRALLIRDYPAARISASTAEIDSVRHNARLQVEIDSGPLFTFGNLEIHGLQRYPADLITRLNTIRPGEKFSQDRLSELQANILNTGYFRSAFANIDPDPAHAALTPIKLELTEIESKRLGLGLGFSTDSGARGQIKWLDRRFLDQDWRLESILRVDRQTQLLGGDLFLRPLQKGIAGIHLQGWIPSVSSNVERSTLTGEEIEKIRNSIRLSTPSRNNERIISASLLADRRSITGVDTLTRRALIAGYSYINRRLDNLLSPHEGHIAGVELQSGLGGVLNKTTITRIRIQGLLLRPLSEKWTGVVRLQAGEIFGAQQDSVPEDLLFRAGGDQSVRGFAFGSLGVTRQGAIVGGNVMAVISAELNYQLTPQWAIAVFTDAGNATATRREFQFKQGSGVGARWRSPIGPINFDIARAHQTGEIRLHFSIGYGF